MTKQFSNYSDLITFTRASKGHALRPVSYGDELVTNGDFTDNIDGWLAVNASATLTAENNELKVVTTATSGARLLSSITVEVGKLYTVSATSTSATGSHLLRLGSTSSTANDILSGTNSTVPTTFTHTFLATSPNLWIYLRNSAAGTTTWDNVSVKEVLFDQPDGTLTLFEHPENVPRVEYDADGNRLGLLVEEQRTNLALNSNDLAADWSEQATTATLTQDAVGPDGKISAWTLVDDNSGGTANTVGINEIWTFASGGTYAISIFAKADGLNWIYFSNVLFDGGTDLNYFDLENVALGASNPNTCFIEDVGNGWRRCTQVMTTTTDLSGQIVIRVANSDGDITVDLDGTSSVQLYGFQVEAGSFPTSYMKNEGTASGAIRSADVASIPVADFGYNQSAGTLFVEWKQSIGAASYVAMLSDGTATNRSMVRQFANGSAYYSTITNSVSQGDILTGTVVDNQSNKIGVVYKHNDAAGVLNGASAVTDATFLVPEGVSTLSIGSYTVGSSQYINGHIKSIQYYPRRLTNAQLQDLTS